MKTMKEYLSTAEGMMQMWEKINEVLDGFDFHTVKTVMEALDWYWVCTEDEEKDYADAGCVTRWSGEGNMYEYRPEYPQLLTFAREQILDAVKGMPDDETHWATSTGGFKVEAWISTDEERERSYRGCKDYPPADDFKHAVDIALYFIAEEYTTF